MSEFFLNIVNMSISASWIVIVVLLLRLLLKKAPKWITVLLWGIVAVRLICPFSIESIMSLMPSAETINPQVLIETPEINTGISILNNTLNPIIQGGTIAVAPEKSINILQLFVLIFSKVWIVGIAGMLFYTVISYFRVKRKIGTAVLLRENIFQSENVRSPFVLGIIKPKIYLPFQMNEQDMEHVIAHERAHIRRKDHLWKPLGFLILTLHWFNPLIWLGYVLLCRDIELACDEKVIKELTAEQKADYSQALLTCSINRRMIAACPLAFGEAGVKDRVKSVLNYKKPAFWIIAVAIVASIAVAVCFLTNPVSKRLKNIEWHDLDARTSAHTTVMIFDGETYRYGGAIEKKFLQELYNIEISRKEISLDRSEDRDKSNTIVLNLPEDPPQMTSYVEGTQVHFSSDFSAVWISDNVKPTLSYKVKRPEEARRIYNRITNNGVGGADSSNVKLFESTVSFANWTEEGEIYTRALNNDKLAISSIRHLPIFKFDRLEDLEQFKQSYSGVLSMDQGWDEVPSFNDATKKYNRAFFEDYTLMLVYVGANNSTHRFKVQSVEHDKSFVVHIEEITKAEAVDNAMAGWFVTVAVSDELIESCTEFDADLDNIIDQTLPSVSLDELREEYPRFFDVSTDGGLTVYIWQMSNDIYKCHLTNTFLEAISDNSFAYTEGATMEEMRMILSTYDVAKEDITVQAIQNPLSSFAYDIDAKYRTKIKELFWQD